MILNCLYSDTVQTQKEWLYHTWSLKINSSAKHDRKDNQDCNNNISETNNKSTQHAIKTVDKRVSRSFYRDSTRSTN